MALASAIKSEIWEEKKIKQTQCNNSDDQIIQKVLMSNLYY